MKCLNTSKATGCDHIPAKLLKPVASTLSHHISTIFNQCVDTCTFPMDAKLAEVVPLYKKADNLTMQNYRPVGETGVGCHTGWLSHCQYLIRWMAVPCGDLQVTCA